MVCAWMEKQETNCHTSLLLLSACLSPSGLSQPRNFHRNPQGEKAPKKGSSLFLNRKFREGGLEVSEAPTPEIFPLTTPPDRETQQGQQLIFTTHLILSLLLVISVQKPFTAVGSFVTSIFSARASSEIMTLS